MLQTPHYPTKWSVVMVFSVIVLLIAGVFGWAFYLNRGTLIVSADHSFSLEVRGRMHECLNGRCELRLAPVAYRFTASKEGYYPEEFQVTVLRWKVLEKNVNLVLVPYLRVWEGGVLPDPESQGIELKKNGKHFDLINVDEGGKPVTSFESLVKPKIQRAGANVVVIDQGRVFFVDLNEGLRTRRFGEEIIVEDALLSDSGQKTLLFVDMAGVKQLWVWSNQYSEFSALDWYEVASFVQWELGVDHRLYVISDQLVDNVSDSLMEEVLNSVDSAGNDQLKSLWQVNLDSGTTRKIADFEGKEPLSLLRRGDRYFVEFEAEEYEELVVR